MDEEIDMKSSAEIIQADISEDIDRKTFTEVTKADEGNENEIMSPGSGLLVKI